METFSLSRANLLPLPLFSYVCIYVCGWGGFGGGVSSVHTDGSVFNL